MDVGRGDFITAVDAARKDKVPPFTLRTRVTLPCGHVFSPVGLAHEPLVVHISVMSQTGAQTPYRTYPVPPVRP